MNSKDSHERKSLSDASDTEAKEADTLEDRPLPTLEIEPRTLDQISACLLQLNKSIDTLKASLFELKRPENTPLTSCPKSEADHNKQEETCFDPEEIERLRPKRVIH